jgi:BCD family chlorophyll transporter-like MFS transporter
MIVELGLSATLTALLISLRFFTSPLRIWFGRISDRMPLRGLHRTWYIALGMVLMVIGFLLTPYAAYGVPGGGSTGLLFAVAAFALLGFGVNLTTPLYFALVSDQSTESERPKVVAIMFIAMGMALVLTAAAMGNALEPYSRQTLHSVFLAVAGLVLLLTLLGLLRLERPKSTHPIANRGDFKAIRELLKNSEVARFFIYLLLTFIAIEAQEIILEPFAAIAFGMTPGETTRLTAIYRTGFLIMLALGAVVVRRRGYKYGAAVGIFQAALGFALLIFSGFIEMAMLFLVGVFLFGLGTGQVSVANLTLMMNMTDSRNSGVFIGTWGFAQAVGVGGGTVLGGLLRDAGVMFLGDGIASYNIVFSFEVVLLLVSLPLVFRLNIPRFREHSDEIAAQDVMASLGES